jgi:hypothetical protein
MAKDMQVIWVRSEPEYFYRRGWTGGSVICPSGNLQEPEDADGCIQLQRNHVAAA